MVRLIIDVREPEEYYSGHVDGALNISPADLLSGAPQLAHVDKDTEIVLYCVSGARSNTGINILRQMGYSDLRNGINKNHVAKKYNLDIIVG